jgi:CDP-glucose 4,6-dehydratase
MNGLDLFQSVYKNKKVLLTGDTGFKGSWMCIWLKELGAEVYGYALPPRTSKDNYVTTGLASKINHLDGDVRDREKMRFYFDKVRPEFAFHLAAQPLVIDSYKDPHYNFETNLMGTVNFFEAVRNCSSVIAAINVTTDKCYKNNEVDYAYKETDPMGGDDPYSASKGCSELITHSYLRSFFSDEGTVNVASARAGNVIGGGDWAENRIIPDIIRSYLNNGDLIVRNPKSVRPWQFVLEPVYGYLKLGEKLFLGNKKFSGGWNFGPNPSEVYTVEQVVNEVKKLIPSIHIASPKDLERVHEAGLLKLDITKASDELGWRPQLNFEETIAFTIKGYLKELKHGTDVYSARVEQLKQYCK